MRRHIEAGVALLAAALAAAAAFAVVGESLSLLTIAFVIALAHALLFGLPSFLFLRSRNWLRGVSASVAGCIIGAVPAGVLLWPLRDSDSASGEWIGLERVQAMLNGVPEPDGWLQYAQALLLFGAIGALGGFAFWATLRSIAHSPRRRGDAEHASRPSRRIAASGGRPFLLGSVPLIAIGVLSVPVFTGDSSCHNMFRDGRTLIVPVVRMDLQIADRDWPMLAETLKSFAAKQGLSLRDDSRAARNLMRSLYLSACNEQGVNIGIAEQRWIYDDYANVIKGRGVSIYVYAQQDDTDWLPIARRLTATLESRWPRRLRFRDGRGQLVQKPQSLLSPGR